MHKLLTCPSNSLTNFLDQNIQHCDISLSHLNLHRPSFSGTQCPTFHVCSTSLCPISAPTLILWCTHHLFATPLAHATQQLSHSSQQPQLNPTYGDSALKPRLFAQKAWICPTICPSPPAPSSLHARSHAIQSREQRNEAVHPSISSKVVRCKI